MDKQTTAKEKTYLPTLCKYIFSFLLLLYAIKTKKDFRYLWFSSLELLTIFLLSDFLMRKSKWFAILQALLHFLYNAQTLVLGFGGSYVSLVMLQNLHSIMDLQGKLLIYSIGVVLVCIFSFLPAKPLPLLPAQNDEEQDLQSLYLTLLHTFLPFLLVFEGMCLALLGFRTFSELDSIGSEETAAISAYSPASGFITLSGEYRNYHQMELLMAQAEEELLLLQAEEERLANEAALLAEEALLQNRENEKNIAELSRQQEEAAKQAEAEAENAYRKEEAEKKAAEDAAKQQKLFDVAALSDYSESEPVVSHFDADTSTNVILIFMEGLSRNIVTDNRGIMPYTANLGARSYNFSGYFNHTFATYRGLQGQLFSGNSLADMESNKLTSISDVLRANGYRTAFINTEPDNSDFSNYLANLHFDSVLTGTPNSTATPYSMTDSSAFAMLYDTAITYQSQGQPFFLSMYSFETHATLDSTDLMFEEGTERVLNRFYNADYYFGQFFNQFLNSPLASNTILILTGDHCTYADEDFTSAFPDYKRSASTCDQIPLMIYYQGNAANIKAEGRNSLDLAPTILDLLGLDKPETFLGNSLFNSKLEDKLDTIYYDSATMYTTNKGYVQSPDSYLKSIVQTRYAQYFASKK